MPRRHASSPSSTPGRSPGGEGGGGGSLAAAGGGSSASSSSRTSLRSRSGTGGSTSGSSSSDRVVFGGRGGSSGGLFRSPAAAAAVCCSPRFLPSSPGGGRFRERSESLGGTRGTNGGGGGLFKRSRSSRVCQLLSRSLFSSSSSLSSTLSSACSKMSLREEEPTKASAATTDHPQAGTVAPTTPEGVLFTPPHHHTRDRTGSLDTTRSFHSDEKSGPHFSRSQTLGGDSCGAAGATTANCEEWVWQQQQRRQPLSGVSSLCTSALALGELEQVECLLPNGILLEVPVHPDDELCRVKEIVLEKATTDEQLPLRGCLSPDADHYVVSYVTLSGRREDCLDESKSIRDIKPFQNILKFSKKTKDKGHYQFRQHVGRLIGKELRDFEELRNIEVNDFRWRMKVFANSIAQKRRARLKKSWKDRIKYQYPPRIASHPCLLQDSHQIEVRLTWGGHRQDSVLSDDRPGGLLASLGKKLGYPEDKYENSVIKVVGEDAFLLDNHRIIDYEHVREKIAMGKVPNLTVMDASSVDVEQASEFVYLSLERDVNLAQMGELANGGGATAPGLRGQDSLTALSLSNVNVPCLSCTVRRPFSVRVEHLRLSPETQAAGVLRSLGLQMGVFHGGKSLCSLQSIGFKGTPNEEGVILVHKVVAFDLLVSDLPRKAKLCVGVYEKKQHRGNSLHPLFWVNASAFDYRGRLRRAATHHMWSYSAAAGDCSPTHAALSPLRRTMGNPNLKEAADLVMSFADDVAAECDSVEYGFIAEADSSLAAEDARGIGAGDDADGAFGGGGVNAHVGTINKMFTQELKDIADRDPLHDLTVQEKDLIWKIREYCLTQLPELLPRIIDCVDYADQAQVVELGHLLDRWPTLRTERALQLLDYAYPDTAVRNFAVKCLRQASDDVILRYLLQLAQALKHECYLHSSLVEFLLERALNNQHIGHHLFWELRAEMNSPFAGLLFGLVLEAYLSAAPEHLKILEHQYTLVEKCKTTRSALSALEMVSRSYDQAKIRFEKSSLAQFAGNHPFTNFVSPLNPSIRCHRIKLEQCRLMNSKMRPQMLAFQNVDLKLAYENVEDVVLMYKRGDDLRQDRLTLQLLKVMDLLWKDAGLDLRLNIYRVVSTDVGEGFIEVVQSAETLCRIQMTRGMAEKTEPKLTPPAAFRKGLLLAWLKGHNGQNGAGETDNEAMRRAQWEFTRSCAAYSVATYVLGIGDRHNDNIMVKTNGQLFHIDFGHFLGNFKHKFGIRRERVPIILSTEFVEVIKADFGLRHNFDHFRDLCERAFLTLRRHGSLLISLLAMMISTGLPELSSEQDLNVIRATLQLDRGDELDALEHFRKDFDQSLKNAWKISLDWWFHMMNQARAKMAK